MLITLKNNKKIDLQWNFLCVEYAEEYDGGLDQLRIDYNKKKHPVKTLNRLMSSIVRAAYGSPLTHEEALTLIKFEDYEKIINFINKETSQLNDYKKKGTSHTPKNKKKRK